MSQKTCFVTIGATASFTRLIQAVLAPDFIQALEGQGYTDLLVQYGQDGKELYEQSLKAAGSSGVKISGFDLDKSGLGRYMRQAKASGSSNKNASEGVVISHAGSGTVLDALRVSVPLVVVPNADLLDNHQVELAEVLAEQEYVVHGKLDNLAKALEDAEGLRQRQRDWPPPNAGKPRKAGGLKGVLDEEMGYLDGVGAGDLRTARAGYWRPK